MGSWRFHHLSSPARPFRPRKDHPIKHRRHPLAPLCLEQATYAAFGRDMPDGNFEFVVGSSPEELSRISSSRRVKSHLSRRSWRTHHEGIRKSEASGDVNSSPLRRSRKRRGRPGYFTVSLDCVLGPESDEKTATPPPRIEFVFGGGRVDPFHSWPAQPHPYVAALVDHYIVHMAVDIPELDQQRTPGQLRTSWFPLVMSEPAAFKSVMLLAADNFCAVNKTTTLGRQLLELKAEAISAVNAAFADPGKCVTDGVIGAVAKLASYEAMRGDFESFQIHMEGLKRMVDLRGGLGMLGLEGLLRRIILWVDLNSGFLLQAPRYFPRETFAGDGLETQPNPERFIAA